MTAKLGKKVPADLVVRLDNVYDIDCESEVINSTHKIGHIRIRLDIDIEAKLFYDSGVNKSAGHIECKKTELMARII
jgi:hypothetical protein